MSRMVIDTDAGSDDAVALLMALRAPGVEVEAITVVAGNVPLAQGLQNALYTVELVGGGVPVHAGLAKPLLRPLETAQFVHGEDGMGDLGLPLQGRSPASGHAVDVLVERLSGGGVILVCLGPLSNLAVALLRAPELAGSVERCVIMGGTGELPGNVTPLAEYNVWADPEAARIVFESGLRFTLVGWDASHRFATVPPEVEERLRAVGTDLARFAMDIQGRVALFAQQKTRLRGFDLPDPLAMAIALRPEIATYEPQFVEVLCQGRARGQTAVDLLASSGREPNLDLVTGVDRAAFLSLLEESLRD